MDELKKQFEEMSLISKALINGESGIMEIHAERHSQILEHKRSILMDVHQNPTGELLVGAKALMKDIPRHSDFPIHWQVQICEKMMRKPKKERLIIAGALIAAEIDRLTYLEKQKEENDRQ